MILEISLLVLAILVIIAVESRDLLHAVIILGAGDALVAFIFLMMAAVDIAITQVAVGAALITFIFIVSIRKTSRMED
jgi:multicomponent Na+:H+ antiporter subunit B